jgi:tRNA A-37 threonylcarbamoyl transferase component Bud32
MVTTAEEMTAGETAAQAGNGRPRMVVAGHYEVDLDDPLGSGGMAIVYRGRDLKTRRTVALKTLRPEYRRDPDTRARFRREARTLAFLHHPNVARVYDLYEDNDAPWAVLEYVPGRSLKQEIAEHGPFDVETTAHLLDQIAGALAHLHRRGLVHLDVKPQNLIVDPNLTVKLIDFGLAQRAGQAQEAIGGLAFGTAAYLAPEQAHGDPVAAATDVYALGCVVYELLTGNPPFAAGESGENKDDVIRAHVEREPVPPSQARADLHLPTWVDDVVLLALAKQPEERYDETVTFARLFRERLEAAMSEADAATVRLTPSPAVDTRTVATASPARPIRGSQVAIAAYRAGGRRLRRANRLRRGLWRLVVAVGVVNIVLALVLLANEGSLPGLIGGEATLHAGGEARVVADSYRFRAGPGLSFQTLTFVERGDRLEITGDAVDADGRVWWPATVDQNGATMDGFIAAEGIEPVAGGGPAWLRELLHR